MMFQEFVEDDEEEDDEEMQAQSDLKGSPNGKQKIEESSQFFNEFTSWRSSQQNAQQSEVNMEMQQLQNNYSTTSNKQKGKPQIQKKEMIMMSENEIDQQRKQIVEDDDIFKEFNKEEQKKSTRSSSDRTQESDQKKDVLEDKGWDDELDIRIE